MTTAHDGGHTENNLDDVDTVEQVLVERSSSRLLPTWLVAHKTSSTPPPVILPALPAAVSTAHAPGLEPTPAHYYSQANQYEDAESGWAYNRFRYYNPVLGAYNAQDPLGLAPRLASAQGYVDHAAHWVDVLGLMAYNKATWNEQKGIWEGVNSNATSKNAAMLREKNIHHYRVMRLTTWFLRALIEAEQPT